MNTSDKTLLMIRAIDQAKSFVAELAVTNPVIYAPMVSIEPIISDQPTAISDVLIFTSSNAVRIYSKLLKDPSLEVFCVGTVTAQSARNQGFFVKQVFSNAAELVAAIPICTNNKTRITYPRAEKVSVDIASALSKFGFLVHEYILYRQKFHPLSKEAQDVIESSCVVIPILSKEMALRFKDAVKGMKTKGTTLVCISADVAAVFSDLQDLCVKTAKKPERAHLIAATKAALVK